jgi:hypothetical protein
MEVIIEELGDMAGLHAADLDRILAECATAANPDADAERRAAAAQLPLALAAHEYAELSWRALQGLRGLIAARRDPIGLDACNRLEEMCLTVASKIVRAVAGAGQPDYDPGDTQTDPNGSAKVALLLIEESRQAWRVLMQPGRARGGGAPAGFVARLDALEAGVLRTFPRAFEFIRPGFDTGDQPGPAGDIARALLSTPPAVTRQAN